jgi:outer membrane lipoprotein carrier protein
VRHPGLLALLLTAAVLPAGTRAESAPPTARELLLRAQGRHRSVSDLTARFVQTYRSGVMGRELKETGNVWLKRPGRMLWKYEEPEKKTFLSDGQRYWFYVPADRQVVVREQAGDKSLPTLLLAQDADLTAQFSETLVGGAPAGRHRLELVPKKPDPEVQRVLLEIDDAGRILVIEILDAQANRSRFTFDAIRENVGVPDKLFRFEAPRGVEVVTG